jgi:SAM-dependent methyltransferase
VVAAAARTCRSPYPAGLGGLMRTSTHGHWSEYWQSRLGEDDSYSTDGRLVDALQEARDLRGLRVLEVGPGSGRDAAHLASLGADVTAIDYVAESLLITHRNATAVGCEVKLVHGDGLAMPFADGSFDVVFHQGLLEHFRDPLPLLLENVRVLAPGGLLLVDVPQRWHPYTVLKHTLIAIDKWFAGWEREYSIGEMQSLMTKAGLEVVGRYGQWMVPQLTYRAVRRGLADAGVARLPLYPRGPEPLRRIRAAVRRRLQPLALYTGANIGVLGQKPS